MILKLVGNSVMVEPLPDLQFSPSGLALPNHWKKPNLKYRVLAVGPGAWVKRKKKRVFLSPEVAVGDGVLTRAWIDGGIKHDFEDGSHRLIIDAADILASFQI